MTTILELIRRDVVDALRGVRVSAGYHVDLDVTDDVKRLTVPSDGRCVVVADVPEPLDDSPMTHQDYHVVFHVYLVAVQSQTDEMTIDERIGMMEADAIVALTANGAHTRGGRAFDTEILAPADMQVGDGTGGIRGREVNAQVYFRTKRNDPYST